jgi:hypothetical protein
VRDDVPLAAEPRPLTESGGAWQAGVGRWDLLYALVLAATAVVVLATTAQPGRTVALAALAAMVPWYLLIGRRMMTAGPDAPALRSGVYLAGLIVLFGVADMLAPNAWFLAFALNPHCYHVTTSRRALGTVVVMSCIGAASIGIAAHGRPVGVVSGVCLGIFAIGFTVAYGGYVSASSHRASNALP